LFGTPGTRFHAGTYFVDKVDGTATPRILITLDDRWTNDAPDWGILKAGAGFISFNRPDRVYSDSCHSADGLHPGPLTTLDGMVAALHDERGWVNITPVSDASVDGYAGETFQRTAPADFTGSSPGAAAFQGWNCCGHSDSDSDILDGFPMRDRN
jgi:hypothetical protein